MFLIDQSGSMADQFGSQTTRSKTQVLADAVNRLIRELTIRCTKDMDGVRNYYDVGVIGYSSHVQPAWTGSLAGRHLVPIREVADNPAQIEKRERKVEDGSGGLVTETVKFPIWFDAVATGVTKMCGALQLARDTLEPWVISHQQSFPPIVINITDGATTDGDPVSPAARLTELATSDGQVLLFNAHISSKGVDAICYPSDDYALQEPLSKQLFQISSLLPPATLAAAIAAGHNVSPGARGFVFNADMVEVIQFLDIGTQAGDLR
jgi:hypothetical protein